MALVVAVALVFSACAGSAGDPSLDEPRDSAACKLLTTDEVTSFFGEKARPARPDPGEGVADTCRWGDANPDAPGKLLSVTLEPSGAVEEVKPGPADNVYELPALGEGARGYQIATGGVRVVFTQGNRRVDIGYDVVPREAQETDAIDRLIRLAGRVLGRVNES